MTLSLVYVEFSINHIMIISRQRGGDRPSLSLSLSPSTIHPSLLAFIPTTKQDNLKAQPSQPFLDFSDSVPIDFDGAARSDADVVIPRVEAEDGPELR